MAEDQRDDMLLDEKEEEERLLIVIQAVKPEVRELLGDEEGAHVNRSLGQYLRWARSPQHRQQALTRAADLLETYPQTQVRVKQLKQKDLHELRGLYPYAATGGEVSAIILQCPVEGCTYRKARQYAGQRLICPTHQANLVPVRKPSTGAMG